MLTRSLATQRLRKATEGQCRIKGKVDCGKAGGFVYEFCNRFAIWAPGTKEEKWWRMRWGGGRFHASLIVEVETQVQIPFAKDNVALSHHKEHQFVHL